jgi:2-polyprenyl-6-methoxyphenol hydroxylase-like FAD-dependent oxidoreductase
LLAANAVKAYQKLGIAENIIARGRLLPAFAILDQGGKIITHADAEAIGRKYGTHNFAIHRAALRIFENSFCGNTFCRLPLRKPFAP